MASLHYGLHCGRGFTALIATPGMGKTTLLFRLLELVQKNSTTVFLFQTLCGPQEFLRSLLCDLGLDAGGNIGQMQTNLNTHLLQVHKRGGQVIVVIDEAQNLDDGVLELVRMLSNFETPGKKMIQIVLSGQPQLADKLGSDNLVQLRQRISVVARLAPFKAGETRKYIEHRVQVAGAKAGKSFFSKEAFALIAEHSCGIPRNINNLCFNSMSLACALRQPQVDGSMVRETIRDLDLSTIGSQKIEHAARNSVFARAVARLSTWRSAVTPLPDGLLVSVVPKQNVIPFETATQGHQR